MTTSLGTSGGDGELLAIVLLIFLACAAARDAWALDPAGDTAVPPLHALRLPRRDVSDTNKWVLDTPAPFLYRHQSHCYVAP